MKEIISQTLADHKRVAVELESFNSQIEAIASQVVACLKAGGKLIFLGNGGSATDAMHMAGEYVSKFSKPRQSLPALALTDNVAVLTSIANDFGYENLFTRQMESLAAREDLVMAFSTSGESKNIVRALEFCKKQGIRSVSFTGSKENTMKQLSDTCFQAPSDQTARIQEAYFFINHLICEVVDANFERSQA